MKTCFHYTMEINTFTLIINFLRMGKEYVKVSKKCNRSYMDSESLLKLSHQTYSVHAKIHALCYKSTSWFFYSVVISYLNCIPCLTWIGLVVFLLVLFKDLKILAVLLSGSRLDYNAVQSFRLPIFFACTVYSYMFCMHVCNTEVTAPALWLYSNTWPDFKLLFIYYLKKCFLVIWIYCVI